MVGVYFLSLLLRPHVCCPSAHSLNIPPRLDTPMRAVDGELLDFAKQEYGKPDGKVQEDPSKFAYVKITRNKDLLKCRLWSQQLDIANYKGYAIVLTL